MPPQLSSGLDDGSIVIWYLTNGRAYQLDGHVDAVVDVCFSPDGRFLASMDPEEKIIVWCTTVSAHKTPFQHSRLRLGISSQDWRIECEYLKPLEVEWKRLSWSSDSKKLAVASRTEKVVDQKQINDLHEMKRSALQGDGHRRAKRRVTAPATKPHGTHHCSAVVE